MRISLKLYLILTIAFISCNKKNIMTVNELKSKTTPQQIALLKKDSTLLNSYISSIYDSINLASNTALNIFTSNPLKYTSEVLLSLKELDTTMPLFGVPIVVKDNFNTINFPTTAGTPALEHFIPKADASIIKSLKKAGAIIMGKTNMHELAFGITSNNSYFGPVKNPHNPLYFAGGSSGGTAAAVAAGIVEIGLGTDTGGSCRIPAALCGVYGFRPTSGLYSSEGVVPLSTTRDTPGLIANSIANIILFDEVITAKKNTESVALKTIRIGIPRAYFYDNLSPGVKKVSDESIEKLKNNGIQLVEVNVDGIPDFLTESINIVLHETYVSLNDYLLEQTNDISYAEVVQKIASTDVHGLFSSGAVAINPNYNLALEERQKLQEAYKYYFAKNNLDAILYPTTPLEAMPIIGSDETIALNGKQEPTFATYIRNMNPGSYAGLPGISIPAGKTIDGLPVGMHLEGKIGKDKALLKLASAISELLEKP